MVTAISELTVTEREAVFKHVRDELLRAMAEGHRAEDDVIAIVSERTNRFQGEVRNVLDALDLRDGPDGTLTVRP